MTKILVESLKIKDYNSFREVINTKTLPLVNILESNIKADFDIIQLESQEDNVRILSDRFENDGKSILPLSECQIEARNTVRDKIISNYYGMEEVNCICNGNSFTTIALKDRYGLPVVTSLCKKCGLLMTNLHMTKQASNEFYEKEYRELYSGDEQSFDIFFEKQLAHGYAIYEKSKKYLSNSSSNILEIGCGAGGILKAFQNEGYNVVGIDIGNRYLEYGRNKGLELINSNAEALAEKYEGEFDLIVLSHVMEHFLDIDEEFAAIKKMLKSGGHIYIEVPGLKNIGAYGYNYLLYFQNAHIFHFHLDTLRQVMNYLGFDFVDGDECVCSIFKMGAEQINRDICENYYSDILNYMSVVEQIFFQS